MKMELHSSMRNVVERAVYNVYAAEDIVTAGGKTVYKKGTEVAKNLITGEDWFCCKGIFHLEAIM